jgi:prepilin-type N-terminal cleavage/methylation domain-containing protein/prepilin-type processing-associated H-X9-DG protein
MKRRPSIGFTLIELLTVIAIIGILASLLLPSLSQGKANAHRAVCISNQRQIILSWTKYAGDHDDRVVTNFRPQPGGVPNSYPTLPWVFGTGHYNHSTITNRPFLYDKSTAAFAYYLETPLIYKCPADRNLVEGMPAIRTYSLNSYVGSDEKAGIDPGFQLYSRVQDIPNPSDIFVFQEANPAVICFSYFSVRMDTNSNGYFHYPATHHRGSGILAYADGHVEAHRWLDPETSRRFSQSWVAAHSDELTPGNKDLEWLRAHTTVPE